MKTINLKDQKEFNAFKLEVIEDIDACNPVDGSGFPLDGFDNPITVDWLWEEYGQHLDGTQSGLGYQLFNEVIAHYENKAKKESEPMTEKRKQEIIAEAEADFLDAYKCGQLNEDCLDERPLREAGYTQKEIELYIKTFSELMYK